MARVNGKTKFEIRMEAMASALARHDLPKQDTPAAPVSPLPVRQNTNPYLVRTKSDSWYDDETMRPAR